MAEWHHMSLKQVNPLKLCLIEVMAWRRSMDRNSRGAAVVCPHFVCRRALPSRAPPGKRWICIAVRWRGEETALVGGLDGRRRYGRVLPLLLSLSYHAHVSVCCRDVGRIKACHTLTKPNMILTDVAQRSKRPVDMLVAAGGKSHEN